MHFIHSVVIVSGPLAITCMSQTYLYAAMMQKFKSKAIKQFSFSFSGREKKLKPTGGRMSWQVTLGSGARQRKRRILTNVNCPSQLTLMVSICSNSFLLWSGPSDYSEGSVHDSYRSYSQLYLSYFLEQFHLFKCKLVPTVQALI